MIIPSKHDGYTYDMARRVYDSGGGSSQPAQQTQIADLPGWAKPYAQETMGKASALAETPYQPYTGERQAQFTPLQQQAFSGAGQLQPSQLGQQAGGIADLAAQRALGTTYDPYQTGQFTGDVAQGYMSPYIQNVVDTQLREADRAAGIAATQQQAQATQAGAFGGGRDAIMRAERERNLGQLKDDIVAKGYQQAYDTGRAQFNNEQQLREQSRQFGGGLGLQGLQTALTGAGTMGQLGSQQYAQESDAIKLQAGLGSTQQQQVQNILDQRYDDFLAQQRHPYQQLEFQSNIIRGTPSGTTTSLYTAAPNTTAQLAGLGAAAYGLSNKMAKGGKVESDDRLVPYDEVSRGRKMEMDNERRAALKKAKEDTYESPASKGLARLLRASPFAVRDRESEAAVEKSRRDHVQYYQDRADYKDIRPGNLYPKHAKGGRVKGKKAPKRGAGLADLMVSKIT